MKEIIKPFEYARHIDEILDNGILLNTKGDKFNSMVIGWGHLGVVWGIDTFCVYVRQSRYTKSQIDKNPHFTISAPLDEKMDPELLRIMGRQSGRDIDKAEYVTLIDPETNDVPGIKECPLTFECEVIYSQDQVLANLEEGIRERVYGKDPSDFHTLYIGKITSAYIIRED